QVFKSFGELRVWIHEAFHDVRLVCADGDSVEDGADIATLAANGVASGTLRRRVGKEQFLTALGIARRNLHLIQTHSRDFVDATEQCQRIVQKRVVGVGGYA